MPRWNVWPAVRPMVQMNGNVVFILIPQCELYNNYFVRDVRSHNCGDKALPSKMSCWIKAFLRGLLQPQKALITGRQGAQEGKFHSLWPSQPLWYEQIKISPFVFGTVGSHSFVCLSGLDILLLVKCSHTRVPRPLWLGTKQTKGLFALPCACSCDEA